MREKRVRRLATMALVAIGALVMWGGEAMAQTGVITLEESVVKGRIQKPEAFYILQHAQLDYETLDTKPSFLEKIEESVEEEPF